MTKLQNVEQTKADIDLLKSETEKNYLKMN